MATFDFRQPSGFNPFFPVTGRLGPVLLPDDAFPFGYTPSDAFQLKAQNVHSLLPFLVPFDPFTIFLLSGGITGTLIGAIAGTGAVDISLQFPSEITFALGSDAQPPQMGYCIGKEFKQNIFTRYVFAQAGGVFLPLDFGSAELIQNQKFKRIYVNHGEVVSFANVSGQTVLTLDISRQTAPDNVSEDLGSSTIKITNSSGLSFEAQILEIQSNWNLVIADPAPNIPQTGDFYEINDVWAIEDPFLMSGFWLGTENDGVGSDQNSGLNLYKTTQNKPYQEGVFLGAYIFGSANTTSGTAILTDIVQPISGLPMQELDEESQWGFFSFGREESPFYIDDKDTRYRTNTVSNNSEERIKATESNYDELTGSNVAAAHLRVEISTGGNRGQDNYYAPDLDGAYLKNAETNNRFKILRQVESNIIDVNITSVDGSETFNPLLDQVYSIVNQSTWMINEDFSVTQEIFTGLVTDASFNVTTNQTTLSYTVAGNSRLAHFVFGLASDFVGLDLAPNDFSNRYLSEHDHSTSLGEPKKKYDKYQDWVFISNDSEFSIISLTPPSETPVVAEPFDLTIVVSGDQTQLVGNNGSITFDSPFDFLGSSTRTNPTGFYISEEPLPASSGNVTFPIKTDLVTIDSGYTSLPYLVDIPLNTRIGFTEGVLAGIEVDGTASSNTNFFAFITTRTVGRGLASLFHILRDEDWLFYQDPDTGHITVRRGSLNFKEYPRKSEVYIGEPSLSENAGSGTSINLNSQQERLRRIQVSVPDFDGNGSPGIYLQIGAANNLHGFLINGRGLVDLQALRLQGVGRGDVESSTYSTVDGNVSPVYIYKNGEIQNLRNLGIDIGISADDGPISFIDATSDPSSASPVSVDNVVAQYFNDNQTVSPLGFFDAHRTDDGEIILLYGESGVAFTIITDPDPETGEPSRSISNGTESINNGIVKCVGTPDDSFLWATPIRKGYAESDLDSNSRFKFSLMLMNDVIYTASIYDSVSNTISIFAKCLSGRTEYIGCYTISLLDFVHETLRCEPELNRQEFLWRPPLLKDDFINDSEGFWTDKPINDNFSFSEKDTSTKDTFVRILGPSSVGTQVEFGGNLGIPSATILPDGTYIFLYDTELGIKSIHSRDRGITWAGSDIILARNARSGIVVDRYLFYISDLTSGIEIKHTELADFYQLADIAFNNIEGKNATSLEESTQQDFDQRRNILIGSGEIDAQRISGYTTSDGILKIFFTDQNGAIACMDSVDSYAWQFSDNF